MLKYQSGFTVDHDMSKGTISLLEYNFDVEGLTKLYGNQRAPKPQTSYPVPKSAQTVPHKTLGVFMARDLESFPGVSLFSAQAALQDDRPRVALRMATGFLTRPAGPSKP